MKIEDLNLSALKYFIDAVELESITLSSEKNNISRPAVSQAILRLEQWCGKTLLSHEKRNFALTDEGKKFYNLAKQNFESLKNGFARPMDSDKALRIGCSASLIDLVFPKIQHSINKSSFPVLKIGGTPRLIELLEQKQIHLAFMVESQKNSAYKSIEFHSGSFELRSKSGKVTDTLIVTESRPEVEAFQRFCSKKKLQFANRIEVESWSIAIRLAEMMNGTCLVPDYISMGKMRSVEQRHWSYPYTSQVAFHKESMLSPLESELIQQLKSKKI